VEAVLLTKEESTVFKVKLVQRFV